MARAVGRKEWIKRLIQQAAESTPVPVSGERVKDTAPRSVRPEDQRLLKSVAGVELDAWITADMTLEVKVEVASWTPEVEKALYAALDGDHSLVSGLLLWEWNDLKAVCAEAAASNRMADCA